MADTKNLVRRGATWWVRKSRRGELIWRSLETPHLSVAQQRRDRLLADAQAHRWGEERRQTFNELTERFVTDQFPTLKPASRIRYVVSLKALLEVFDGLALTDISAQTLKRFELARRAKGVQGSTIRRDLACLSSMFSLAEEEEWIIRNPVRPFLRARAKRGLTENPPRTRHLNLSEEIAVLAATPPKSADRIAFAIDTGLRREEQFSLLKTDVYLQDGFVRVRGEVTKSGRTRDVPLLPRAAAIAGRLMADGAAPYLFVSQTGTRYAPNSPTVSDALTKACRRAAVPRATWHDLRRTCGCRLLNAYGYELLEVSKWLGHASVTITERCYAFLAQGRLQDKLARHMAAAKPHRIIPDLNHHAGRADFALESAVRFDHD